MNKLTVYFDDPFWVGVFERLEDDRLETARVVFGSEPRDYEVYEFVLRNYYELSFSLPVNVETQTEKRINPKRLQRKITKELQQTGVGTKAQQAMKIEHESKKQERKKLSRQKKEFFEEMKFQKRQEKKKEKKKGH